MKISISLTHLADVFDTFPDSSHNSPQTQFVEIFRVFLKKLKNLISVRILAAAFGLVTKTFQWDVFRSFLKWIWS